MTTTDETRIPAEAPVGPSPVEIVNSIIDNLFSNIESLVHTVYKGEKEMADQLGPEAYVELEKHRDSVWSEVAKVSDESFKQLGLATVAMMDNHMGAFIEKMETEHIEHHYHGDGISVYVMDEEQTRKLRNSEDRGGIVLPPEVDDDDDDVEEVGFY